MQNNWIQEVFSPNSSECDLRQWEVTSVGQPIDGQVEVKFIGKNGLIESMKVREENSSKCKDAELLPEDLRELVK